MLTGRMAEKALVEIWLAKRWGCSLLLLGGPCKGALWLGGQLYHVDHRFGTGDCRVIKRGRKILRNTMDEERGVDHRCGRSGREKRVNP